MRAKMKKIIICGWMGLALAMSMFGCGSFWGGTGDGEGFDLMERFAPVA